MSVIEREQQQVDPAREERARVLEAAALEIEVRGWTQGKPYDDEGRMCLMGAIGVALGWPCRLWSYLDVRLIIDAWDEDWDARLPHVEGWVDGSLPMLATWNDGRGRTAGEVAFVLRWRAAEIRDGR